MLIACVAVMLALAGVLKLNLREERRQLIEQAYAEADRHSLRLAAHASEVISRADQALQVIKSVREHRSHVTLQDPSLSRVTGDYLASAFIVVDHRGKLMDSTSPDVVLDFADDTDFQHLQNGEDGALLIGQSIADPVRGGWVIPLMRRLDGPDGFDGAVVALLRPHALVLGNLDERSDSMVRSIVGLDGTIRSRRLGGKVTVGGRIPQPETIVSRLRSERAESKIGTSPIDGRPVIPAATPIEAYPLLAIVSNSAPNMETRYAQARSRILGWGGAAALLLAAGAGALWHQARLLERSRHAARRINTLYEATLEGCLDSLWLMEPVWNADGGIVDFTIRAANERSLSMIQLSREHVIGQRMGDLVPAAKTDGLLQLLVQVYQTQQTIEIEAPASTDPVRGKWLHLQGIAAGDSIALIARDITERRAAAQQLAEREAFLRTLLDALPVAVYAKSARAADHGQVRFWNKAAERQYGLSSEQAIGSTTHDYLPGSAAQAILQDTEVARAGCAMAFSEIEFGTEAGMRYLDFLKAPVLGLDGELDMILVIAEDVTAQRAAAEQLRLVSRVVQESGDAVLLTDRHGRVVLANPAFAKVTGRALATLVDATAPDVGLPMLRDSALPGVEQALREHRHWAGESRLPRLQGAALETWLNITSITDETGATTHNAWLFSDISVLKTQERQLAELARRDALTQLSNRRHFEEELEAATARARRQGQPLALVYMDLDGFKQVNDTLGHGAGDQLLIEVAQRLRSAVRSIDFVSRLGGDEFTVILEHAGTDADRALQCQRMLDDLSHPYQLAGQSIVSTPSIGVAVYQPGEHLDSLRHRADVAMYEAKRSGKGKVRIAEPALA